MNILRRAVHLARELNLRYRPLEQLLRVKKTAALPREAARLAMAAVVDTSIEQVLALHLDEEHRGLGSQIVSAGSRGVSGVRVRDIFTAALLSNTAALIVAHYHPFHDPAPSWQDRALSDQLRQAGELLGVDLLDFVIVTDSADALRYFSFKASGSL